MWAAIDGRATAAKYAKQAMDESQDPSKPLTADEVEELKRMMEEHG